MIIILLSSTVFIYGRANAQSSGEEVDLKTSDPDPLGQRIPLILVHGWNSDASRWDTFLDFVKQSPRFAEFNAHYKIYRFGKEGKNPFGYDWSRRIEDNAGLLKIAIEDSGVFPDGKQISILAHSMGGLVARSYIERRDEGWHGAERLRTLITLGTPHHGAPLANPAWLQNASSLEDHDSLIRILTSNPKLPLNNDGGYGLGWDNFDGQMPAQVWNGERRRGPDIPRACRFTEILNSNLTQHPARASLLARYRTYAGYYASLPVTKITVGDLMDMARSGDPLRATNVLTAFCLRDGSNGPAVGYAVNDGLVPLSSALLLDPPVTNLALNLPFASIDAQGSVEVRSTILEGRAPARFKLFPGVNHSDLTSDPAVLGQALSDLLEDEPKLAQDATGPTAAPRSPPEKPGPAPRMPSARLYPANPPSGRLLVGCLSGGQLRVLNPSTLQVTEPTGPQKSSWRQKTQEDTDGPDVHFSSRGTYRANETGEPGDLTLSGVVDTNQRTVCSEDELLSLVSPKPPDTAGTIILRFSGWIGDKDLVVLTESNDQESQVFRRGVVDIANHRLLPFDGWPTPQGGFAIVPDQEGLAKAGYYSQDVYEGSFHGFKKLPPQLPRYYAVKMRGPVETYRFGTASNKHLISLRGRPFDVGFSSKVNFSPDGVWAIVNRRVPDSYLVNLVWGGLIKLPGQWADFFTDIPVASTAAASPEYVVIPSVGMGGVRLGMTRAQVRAVVGAPSYVYYGHTIYGGYAWEKYRDLLVAFDSAGAMGKVVEIQTESAKYKTADGLSRGSDFRQVRQSLRDVAELREAPFDMVAISYSDKTAGLGFCFQASEPAGEYANNTERMRRAFVAPDAKPIGIGVFKKGASWKQFFSSE